MPRESDEFIPTRKSLLQRLKNWDDQESWRDFFETYWRLIYSVARKAGFSDAEAQDVVQETIISVAKQFNDYRYDPSLGSFKHWLRQLTQWRIADQLRKKQYQKGGERFPREIRLETEVLADRPGPVPVDLGQMWEEEWQKGLFTAALARVKENVNAKQYQMFQLHVLKEMPAKTVAKRLGVKLAEVYFAKYKVSSLVKKQVKLLEDQMR